MMLIMSLWHKTHTGLEASVGLGETLDLPAAWTTMVRCRAAREHSSLDGAYPTINGK